MANELQSDVRSPVCVVNIPNPVYQSMKGRYFLGQTRLLSLGRDSNAWGGLVNPEQSGVNLYISTFTVTNFSNLPLIAQTWLNPVIPGPCSVSKKVVCANTAILPVPQSCIKLQYAELTTEYPTQGVNPFDQIIAPYSTIVDDKEGRIIIPPGGSFIVYLRSPNGPARARVACGWWEDRC